MRIILLLFILLPFVGLSQAIVRVGGSGGGSTDTASLSNRINQKLNISDNYDSVAKIGAQRSVVHADNNNYAQSPIAFQTEEGWAYLCTNESSQHITTGPIQLRRTKDGSNWSEPWTVSVSGFDTLGVPSFGTNGNRIFISFQRVFASVPFYNEIFFAHSDDGGFNWELDDSVGLHGAQDEIFAYGKIKSVHGDTIYASAYSNWSLDTASSFMYRSYDNGESWEFGFNVMQGLFAGVFPTGGSINEMDWEVVEQGSSVATTKLIALVRSEKYFNFHYQLFSNNGGTTWSNCGVTEGAWFTEYNAINSQGDADVGSNTYPVNIIKKDQYLYVVYGHRGINGVANGDHQIRVVRGIALSAYDDPAEWSRPRSHYFATAGVKTFPNDFGYPVPFVVNNQLFTSLYDLSYRSKSGGSISSVKTRIITIPLEGNNYFEANERADQAIPTGTETTVLTRRVRIDSEGAYNQDSTKIYFPHDGWYTISARLTFEASSSGTYRRVTLYMIDQGDETGPSPSAMEGKYIITRRSIAPSTNAEFNRVELSGQIYAYAGMELRLTVQHDVGSDLDLLNTDMNNRATIYFKKSD